MLPMMKADYGHQVCPLELLTLAPCAKHVRDGTPLSLLSSTSAPCADRMKDRVTNVPLILISAPCAEHVREWGHGWLWTQGC
jgi:hypothetical protein